MHGVFGDGRHKSRVCGENLGKQETTLKNPPPVSIEREAALEQHLHFQIECTFCERERTPVHLEGALQKPSRFTASSSASKRALRGSPRGNVGEVWNIP